MLSFLMVVKQGLELRSKDEVPSSGSRALPRRDVKHLTGLLHFARSVAALRVTSRPRRQGRRMVRERTIRVDRECRLACDGGGTR